KCPGKQREEAFSKKWSTKSKGSERNNTYPEAPGLQRPQRPGDCFCCSSCCYSRGGGGGAFRGCCCYCCYRGKTYLGGVGGGAATPEAPRRPGARELP